MDEFLAVGEDDFELAQAWGGGEVEAHAVAGQVHFRRHGVF
jgi:hypothetical protein